MTEPTISELYYIYFLIDDKISFTPAGGFKDIVAISHDFSGVLKLVVEKNRFRIVRLAIYPLEVEDWDFQEEEWYPMEDIDRKILILDYFSEKNDR